MRASTSPHCAILKDINEIGACRMCVVEVKGARSLVAACVYPVNEGMEVFTNTPKVQESRKLTLELLLSVHDRKCLSCKRSGSCELQSLCYELGVDDAEHFDGAKPEAQKDESTEYLVRDNGKCILCRRCVAACANQHVAVIGPNGRGFDTHIGCTFERPLNEVACVSCGQCIVSLPDGCPHRARSVRRGPCSDQRSGEICRGTDRSGHPCNFGRMLRHAGRHQCQGQDGCRPAPPGL